MIQYFTKDEKFPISRKAILSYFRKDGTLYPPWMKAFEPLSPPDPPTTQHGTVKASLSRITKAIEKTVSGLEPRMVEISQAQVGKQQGALACSATDGYRALLVSGSTLPFIGEWMYSPPISDCAWIELPEAVYLACKRLQTVIKDSGVPHIRIDYSMKNNTLTLSAKNPFEMEGTELIPNIKAHGVIRDFIVYLDVQYLLDVLGTWPMKMYFQLPTNIYEAIKSPVLLTSEPEEFIYVLMPCRV